MSKQFIRLGRGNALNKDLVATVIATKSGRYFVRDIYNVSFEVDRKHFNRIIEMLGTEIINKETN